MREYIYNDYIYFLLIICYSIVLIINFILKQKLPKYRNVTPKDVPFDMEKINETSTWKLLYLIYIFSVTILASGLISMMGGIIGYFYAETFNYSKPNGVFIGLIIGCTIGLLYYLTNINRLQTKNVALGGAIFFWFYFVIIVIILGIIHFFKWLF